MAELVIYRGWFINVVVAKFFFAGLLYALRLIYHCYVIYVFYDQMDVSEDQAMDYPLRLYDEGVYNLENKNINHNGRIGNIPQIIDTIG